MVINFVFWFYWCALMFNGPYIKMRSYLMQKFCMRLYQNMLLKEAQKKALGKDCGVNLSRGGS